MSTATFRDTRPGKCIQDLAEALQADAHARDERVEATLALDIEARFTGLTVEVVSERRVLGLSQEHGHRGIQVA